MDFDLRLLRHARALAEEGSYARAARSLHLTQPALTRSIQELERRTGLKLFDRDSKRVGPTDLGRLFLAHARELLGRAEALDREVATMRGAGTGSLVVGSGTMPTVIFMADALASFLGKHPGVAVRLVNDNWSSLVEALRRREIDFVVAAPPPTEEMAGLVVDPLAPRQGYFFVRPGHPLVRRRELALADVAAFPILCTSRLPPALVDRLLDARGPRGAGRSLPDVASESHEMMQRIAATTDHVLLSSLAGNRDALAQGRLVALPLADPVIRVSFAVLRLESRTLPPIADQLVAEIVAADRAAVALERELAARLAGREPAPASARRAPRARPIAAAAASR